MPTKCVKVVQKTAQKAVINAWNLTVKKRQKVEKILSKNSYTQVFNNKLEVLQFFIDRFCTKILCNSPLLIQSFTRFAHRTTIITTTIFVNKEENY